MGKENTKLRIVDVDFSLLPLPFLSEIIKMSKERGGGGGNIKDAIKRERKKEKKKQRSKRDKRSLGTNQESVVI